MHRIFCYNPAAELPEAVLFRHISAGFDSMPSPEGNRPHQLDLRSLKPLPKERQVGSGVKHPASQPESQHAVPSQAQGAGEKLENKARDAILPSYYDDIFRRADAKWLDPKPDKELLRGWDNLAEFAIDKADIIAKPNTPYIPKDDNDAIDEDNLLAHDMTANMWEEHVLWVLDVNEDRHLIPEFKQHMQEYRRAVKAIAHLWREEGLL
jgi:hypothetical protein